MKTNLDDLFKTDEALEKNGVWHEIKPGVAFLLLPYKGTNPNVKAAMSRYYKPYARQIENGTLHETKATEINVKIFVDVCLKDWKGVEIDGKPVACEKEMAVKMFIAMPELFNSLMKSASDFNTFKDDVGNS